jgi:hypothetical protein
MAPHLYAGQNVATLRTLTRCLTHQQAHVAALAHVLRLCLMTCMNIALKKRGRASLVCVCVCVCVCVRVCV